MREVDFCKIKNNVLKIWQAENLNDRTISYKQSAIYIRRASKRNG